MGDDEVIKRRLLIDGDGTGDDRRLNILLKTFLKWCLTKNDSPENNQIVYDRLLAQLAQCSFAAIKSDYIGHMIQQELKNYESLSNSIETSIKLARKEIETSKEELILAKKIRKNRVEYDVLAKVIMTQPDRKKTTQQLDVLKRELADLQEEKVRLEKKLKFRKNDFFVLMHSIKELQAKLDDESSSDEDNSLDEMEIDDDDDLRDIITSMKKESKDKDKDKSYNLTAPITLPVSSNSRKISIDSGVLQINLEKDKGQFKLDDSEAI